MASICRNPKLRRRDAHSPNEPLGLKAPSAVLATGSHAGSIGPDQCTISSLRLFLDSVSLDGTDRPRHRWHTRNRGSQLHFTQGLRLVHAVKQSSIASIRVISNHVCCPTHQLGGHLAESFVKSGGCARRIGYLGMHRRAKYPSIHNPALVS
jgi:hypothetical protein